jgi:hypothetical protein
MVFAIDPGLLHTAMSEAGLSADEPSLEQFTDAFAREEDVPAALLAYLASGAADVLSGRNIDASGDVAQRRPGQPRLKSAICTYCRNANSHCTFGNTGACGHWQVERACGPAPARPGSSKSSPSIAFPLLA